MIEPRFAMALTEFYVPPSVRESDAASDVRALQADFSAAPEGAEEADVDTKRFTVEGLTVDVPDPEFQAVQEKIFELEAQKRNTQEIRRYAKRLAQRATYLPGAIIFNDPSAFSNLQEVRNRVEVIFNDGAWLSVPYEYARRRTGNLAQAVIESSKIFPDNFRDLLPDGVEDVAEEEEKAFQDAYNDIRGEYEEALMEEDFSRTALTREELKTFYFSWLARQTSANEELERLPFESSEEQERRVIYEGRVVEGTVMPQAMLEWTREWADGRSDKERLDAFAAYNRLTAQSTGQFVEVPFLEQLVQQFVPLALNLQTSYQAELLLRGLIAQEQASVEALNAAASQQDALEAARRILGPQSARESFAQVAAFRTKGEALFIAGHAEAHIAALEKRLARMSPYKKVPLVIQRNMNTSAANQLPTLRVRVVPAPGQVNALSLLQPGVEWTFIWVTRTSTGLEISETVQPDAGAGVASSYTPDTSQNDGAVYAVAKRYENGVPTGRYVSETARIVNKALCLRCQEVYWYGTPRVFGECTWRQHPQNEQLKKQLQLPEAGRVLASAGALSQGFAEIVPRLDDSIFEGDGKTLIISDSQLLRFADTRTSRLRERYFTYAAVLKNMNERAYRRLGETYNANAAEAIGDLFKVTERLPLRELVAGALHGYNASPLRARVEGATNSDGSPLALVRSARKAFNDKFSAETIVAKMHDATHEARALLDIPLEAVLFAVFSAPFGAPLRDAVATKSELRFLGSLRGLVREVTFLHAAFAAVGEETALERMQVVPGKKVFLGRLRSDIDVRREYLDATPATLALMNGAEREVSLMRPYEIELHAAWRAIGKRPVGLFVDSVGEARLQERVLMAKQRNGTERKRKRDENDGAVDWTDTHSSVTDQPSVCKLLPGENGDLLVRASERLRTSKNFRDMYQEIQSDVAAGQPRRDVLKKVREYNVSAFFGATGAKEVV